MLYDYFDLIMSKIAVLSAHVSYFDNILYIIEYWNLKYNLYQYNVIKY